jgi:hypothetical protein
MLLWEEELVSLVKTEGNVESAKLFAENAKVRISSLCPLCFTVFAVTF